MVIKAKVSSPTTTPAALKAAPAAAAVAAPPHFLADVYTFDWSAFKLRVPLISASAVALCLFGGVALGHPGGALLAGGGALTVGFGINQCVADSRILPMLLAVLAISTATLAGTLAGHSGYSLVIAAAISAAIYGVLTVRHAGLAWVGQQASIALFVASAFPYGLRQAFIRAGLIALGGSIQILITSIGLRMLPELGTHITQLHRSLYTELYQRRNELLTRLYVLPNAIADPDRTAALSYAIRLCITVALASELYHRLGIQSGYWIPMTALLVQKPAFFETLGRATARVAGTILGATLATHLAAHVNLSPWHLAALTAFFAFWCYATVSVNYALFTLCITSYIVFLLSLNQIPGPEIAYRRAYCTTFGAIIALLIHLDALRRNRSKPTTT
jgi:hypothetical protein